MATVFWGQPASAQTKEVVAEKGDGIFRLLKRYGLPAADYMQDFITLNKDALGKDNTLIAGAKYKLPDTANTVSDVPDQPVAAKTGLRTERHEIFGKKYENVVIESEQLKGAVYYLMSGHGGPDPGALGKYNNHLVAEDEYAYDVTLRLARNLISEGATVYMITIDPNDGIRDDSYLKVDKDEVCYPRLTIPLNQIKRLNQRSDAVNKLYVKNKGAFQRMVAIHVDSRSRAENIDVFFYHDKRSETGEKAAKILQQTFARKYQEHQPGRGYGGTVSERNLYVVKNTYPPAVYIELGNVNHQRDIQRLIISANRQALANWLYEGLVQDFKTNK
ncbi:N-acetylmuramoyl-L-alanine amidase [Maribellus sp. YY47]|uniref:N-acetylmuramoyl-L-alanine amidase family protein n=1 Tax=Maribellus sp. YY47 TaxID=2929486 RepID=UPI002001D4F9|nr:N-acetylmuramoyl-L-alanine amidase [Maribellus sp. YY47]MCK3682886.1 N-acetylmuramoyl-L-alanine amidase [Maribellus sp. YY47]